MAEFGVRGCLWVTPVVSSSAEALGDGGSGVVLEQQRSDVQAYLRAAGIDVFVGEGISPHAEPQRAWGADWESLRTRVFEGQVHALGEMIVHQGSPRALRILDQHMALAVDAGVPLLVAHAPWLEGHWQEELHRRAALLPELWHWTRVTPSFALEALQQGQRVIAAVSGRGFQPSDVNALLLQLSEEERQRLAVGSSRGRGLNPFALAAVDMMLDQQGLEACRETLLKEPALVQLLKGARARLGAKGACVSVL